MNVMTPYFRINFPTVFEPKINEMNQKLEYSLVALFPKGADLSALKKAALEATQEKWGMDEKKWPKNIRSPFRDQGEKAKENEHGNKVLPAGHEEGAIFLNLKSTQRPGVVDQNNQDIIDKSEVYSGCWCRATVRAFAYDQAGNRGVSFGLQNLQKVKDDAPFGSRVKAQDDFAPIKSDGGSASSIFDN